MKRLLPLTCVTTASVGFAALCGPNSRLGYSVRERGVASGFRTRAQIWPGLIQ
jgi:hypothetical protein